MTVTELSRRFEGKSVCHVIIRQEDIPNIVCTGKYVFIVASDDDEPVVLRVIAAAPGSKDVNGVVSETYTTEWESNANE
jgi:hypothetical protein